MVRPRGHQIGIPEVGNGTTGVGARRGILKTVSSVVLTWRMRMTSQSDAVTQIYVEETLYFLSSNFLMVILLSLSTRIAVRSYLELKVF